MKKRKFKSLVRISVHSYSGLMSHEVRVDHLSMTGESVESYKCTLPNNSNTFSPISSQFNEQKTVEETNKNI